MMWSRGAIPPLPPSMRSSMKEAKLPLRLCWSTGRKAAAKKLEPRAVPCFQYSRATNYCDVRSSSVADLMDCQLVMSKHILFDDLAADQVFLNNPLQDGGGAGVIPNAFRINNGNRSVHANPE